MKRKILTGAIALIVAGMALLTMTPALKSGGLHQWPAPEPALASSSNALALVDRALAGPAGPDDEGHYNLIDPIGPGGATLLSADNEVFARTMIGGVYTKWQPYHDPFVSNGGYNGGPQGGLP